MKEDEAHHSGLRPAVGSGAGGAAAGAAGALDAFRWRLGVSFLHEISALEEPKPEDAERTALRIAEIVAALLVSVAVGAEIPRAKVLELVQEQMQELGLE